jgi:hypothetical protein
MSFRQVRVASRYRCFIKWSFNKRSFTQWTQWTEGTGVSLTVGRHRADRSFSISARGILKGGIFKSGMITPDSIQR